MVVCGFSLGTKLVGSRPFSRLLHCLMLGVTCHHLDSAFWKKNEEAERNLNKKDVSTVNDATTTKKRIFVSLVERFIENLFTPACLKIW